MVLILQETHAYKRALGSLWLLLLGLYGSCSWVSMAPAPVDWPNCKSHKASHVPRGQGHIRLHQVKVTSGHIKSQQVTSGRPTTGHGFAHEVAVHLTSILFLSLLLSSWSLLVSSGLFWSLLVSSGLFWSLLGIREKAWVLQCRP